MQREHTPPAAMGDVHVRVYTLGRFLVEVDAAPLRFNGRAPRRPLALLKVLVALGGESVPAESLGDALWPDADGDAAAKSLSVTLTRLRHLIGARTVRMQDGRVSLEPGYCWVDALACGRLLEQVRGELAAGRLAPADECMEQVLALYHRPLLEGETEPAPVLSARERLHGRFLRQLEALAQAHCETGDRKAALALYQRGLERDELDEPLVQGLLEASLASGCRAEGLAAYHRHEVAVRTALGAEPSPALRALHERLRAARPAEPVTQGALVQRLPDEPAIAVRAFENLSGDAWQAYFGNGLSDNVATALARIPGLLVVARHATDPYRGRPVDVRDLGQALGVRHLLEGSVLRSGERLRISAQLTDVRTGGLAWASTYDRTMQDVLAVMDDITRHIVTELGVSLLYGERMRYFMEATRSAEAFDKFLLAMHHYHSFQQPRNDVAKRLLADAIELDPRFSHAMALLGYTHLNDVRLGWGSQPEASFAEAEAWGQRSLEVNPHCTVGLNLMSRILTHRGRHDRAIALSTRMIEIEPSDSASFADHALTLILAGKLPEGTVAAREALRLSPVPNLVVLYVNAEAHYFQEHFDEARSYYERLLEHCAGRGDQASNARQRLVAIHMRTGHPEEARSLMDEELALNPDITVARRRDVLLRWPYRDRSWLEPYLDLLRRAGMPD